MKDLDLPECRSCISYMYSYSQHVAWNQATYVANDYAGTLYYGMPVGTKNCIIAKHFLLEFTITTIVICHTGQAI